MSKAELLEALPTLGILTEYQWAIVPDKEEVNLVNTVLQLNNISTFSAITQLGKVSTNCKLNFCCCIFTSPLGMSTISLIKSFFLLQTCEDFIIECRFAGMEFPCFQEDPYLTWKTSTSHYGVCCSFHFNPRQKGFVPFAATTFGSEGGLSVIGTVYPSSDMGRSGNMVSSGLMVSTPFTLFPFREN